MVERLAVPKQAAMAGNVGAAARWRDGAEEVAAVAEQDADGVEEDGDVLGHGVAGLILWRIGQARLDRRATSASMCVIILTDVE